MATEIPERKVQTSQSLKYLWTLRKISGFYSDRHYNFLQKLHIVFVIIAGNIFTSVSLIVQLFFVDSMKQLLNNLPGNISIVASLVKYVTFVKMRVELSGIDELFAKLDSNRFTAEQIGNLNRLTSFCKRFTLVAFSLYVSAVSFAALDAAESNRQALIFVAWMPFNYHDPPWVYWTTLAIQYGCILVICMQNVATDISGPIYFIVLNAHLEIVLERIQSVGWDLEKTQEENYQALINCIEDHRVVIKIFDVLQNTVSYTIFLQFASSAAVLSMAALLFILYPPNFVEFVLILFYFFDVTLQILPCCYYSNNFMLITNRIVTAIYSSNIFDQSVEFKKIALIFMQMTQKSRVIVAGKVIPVTLETFVSILKLSYSLLTLANRLR